MSLGVPLTPLEQLRYMKDNWNPTTSRYGLNPADWVKERLHESLWSKQMEIMASVVHNRRTAVRSCFDIGKSWTVARLVCWWMENHPIGEAFAVTSAPTHSQVKTILWREINAAHGKAGLMGRVNQTEWLINNQIIAMGRKPSDYDVAAFQGIHARYVLVVLDEAGGVERSLWDGADALITNEESRLVAIGNPDDPQSYFQEVCRPDSGWNTIHVSAFDTPNFTGEPIPSDLAMKLISQQWVDEKRLQYGEDSPYYISRVLGEFPETAYDGVIPISWAEKSRNIEPVEGKVALGVDVGASTGGDETVICERRGNHAGRKWTFRSDESEYIVGKVVQAIKETGAEQVCIDSIGVGFGVGGHLKSLKKEGVHNAKVHMVNVSEAAKDSERFINKRAEIWWAVGRESAEKGTWSLQGVDDDDIGQLTAPKYSLNARGKIVIEPKDETKKRIGRSPDHADARLLSFYEPVERTKGRTFGNQISQARIA